MFAWNMLLVSYAWHISMSAIHIKTWTKVNEFFIRPTFNFVDSIYPKGNKDGNIEYLMCYFFIQWK